MWANTSDLCLRHRGLKWVSEQSEPHSSHVFSDAILTWHILVELKEWHLLSWLAFLPTQILGLVRSELCARNQKLENFSWKLLYIWIGRYSRASQSLETRVALWLLDQTVSNCGVPHVPRVSLHAESQVLRDPWHQPRVSYTPAKASWWHFQFLFTLSKSFLFDFFKLLTFPLEKAQLKINLPFSSLGDSSCHIW